MLICKFIQWDEAIIMSPSGPVCSWRQVYGGSWPGIKLEKISTLKFSKKREVLLIPLLRRLKMD